MGKCGRRRRTSSQRNADRSLWLLSSWWLKERRCYAGLISERSRVGCRHQHVRAPLGDLITILKMCVLGLPKLQGSCWIKCPDTKKKSENNETMKRSQTGPQTRFYSLWPEQLLHPSGCGAAVQQSAAPVCSRTMCAAVKTLKIWTHNGPPPRLAAVSH